MKPEDPIHGCAHGAAIDPALKGLTKWEWYVGCAMPAYRGPDLTPDPEKLVEWAMRCADLAIEKMNPPADPEPPAPEPPEEES